MTPVRRCLTPGAIREGTGLALSRGRERRPDSIPRSGSACGSCAWDGSPPFGRAVNVEGPVHQVTRSKRTFRFLTRQSPTESWRMLLAWCDPHRICAPPHPRMPSPPPQRPAGPIAPPPPTPCSHPAENSSSSRRAIAGTNPRLTSRTLGPHDAYPPTSATSASTEAAMESSIRFSSFTGHSRRAADQNMALICPQVAGWTGEGGPVWTS